MVSISIKTYYLIVTQIRSVTFNVHMFMVAIELIYVTDQYIPIQFDSQTPIRPLEKNTSERECSPKKFEKKSYKVRNVPLRFH